MDTIKGCSQQTTGVYFKAKRYSGLTAEGSRKKSRLTRCDVRNAGITPGNSFRKKIFSEFIKDA